MYRAMLRDRTWAVMLVIDALDGTNGRERVVCVKTLVGRSPPANIKEIDKRVICI